MTEIVNITDRERAKDRLIAQLSAGRDALAVRLDKVLSDRLELKRINEALEADAKRWAALRNAVATEDELFLDALREYPFAASKATPAEVDAAIDAARKGTP